MLTRSNGARIAGITLAAALASSASAGLSYTFDNSDQGWTSINDTSFFGWDGSIGSGEGGEGALRGVDQAAGAIWYFAAPVMDLGDLSASYGESLEYDILGLVGSQTSVTGRADVMLSGAGITIGIEADVQPTTAGWTSWSIDFSAASDWRVVSSEASGTLSSFEVTEMELRAILADLDGLYIRGEYTNGSDSAALDNVTLVPAPGAMVVLGLGGLLLGRNR